MTHTRHGTVPEDHEATMLREWTDGLEDRHVHLGAGLTAKREINPKHSEIEGM